MPRIHLFNPENDLALADNHANYTPPAAALRLRRGGALLPMLWADDSDAILVPDTSCMEEADRLRALFGLRGSPVTHSPAGFVPDPWGWSEYTASAFRRAGVDTSLLPGAATLSTLRNLSHRRITVAIHHCLGTDPSLTPVEAKSVEELSEAVARFGGDAVVKLPWSSSGRGVILTGSMDRENLWRISAGSIRRQGSVMIEPRFDRIADFAMLFHCSEGTARFEGLSAFATDSRGAYLGNIIAPQERIASRIDAGISDFEQPLSDALTRLVAPHYSGWCGIDMLTYRTPSGGKEIAPCIELNLRRTMGVAALCAARRMPLSPSSEKILSVSPRGILITDP